VNITVVGAGPAGLYFAIAAKRLHPAHSITVLERRPAHTTYGWGIVFWDDLVHSLERTDPESARDIRAGAVSWTGQRLCMQDRRPVHLGGTGYGMSRQRFMDVLIDRAVELGVDVRFDREADADAARQGADLVVLADGAASRLRRARSDRFGTDEAVSRNKHIWLGSTVPFDDFTFALEHTPEGWIWFHGYRFAEERSTVIVECTEETWQRLGFDTADEETCLRDLTRIFARHLAGHPLLSRREGLTGARWDNFPTVTNARWHHDRVVLVGDAAHTAHFSVGSGTKLAVEDAIALASSIAACRPEELTTALQRYQDHRLPAVAHVQAEAARSAAWFADVDRLTALAPIDLGFSLRTRRQTDGPPPHVIDRASLRYGLHLATQWRLGRTMRRAVSRTRTAAQQRAAGRQPIED
jgi:anthraniloyl-CoA monooxygenase